MITSLFGAELFAPYITSFFKDFVRFIETQYFFVKKQQILMLFVITTLTSRNETMKPLVWEEEYK